MIREKSKADYDKQTAEDKAAKEQIQKDKEAAQALKEAEIKKIEELAKAGKGDSEQKEAEKEAATVPAEPKKK